MSEVLEVVLWLRLMRRGLPGPVEMNLSTIDLCELLGVQLQWLLVLTIWWIAVVR